ncbi:transmembrane protein [Planoprotostelium fungivorum]|uniref:Transmembrane protein n=1 Tax=Planoprotostelium fungivorum TaxID=1890364 RepID=A0A2P6MSP9_9EUKA|nr:transmembrane protein [Planoprotostelium fungivorum]
MFADLHKILVDSTDKNLRGLFVLVTDTILADGSFVLHHYIHSNLRAEKKTILISLDQTPFHYNSVGKKLGFNLADSNYFSIINGLTNNDPVCTYIRILIHLRSLYVQLKEKIDQEKGVNIVLDNVNILYHMYTREETDMFIQYCTSLIRSQPSVRMTIGESNEMKESESTLVMLMHEEEEEETMRSIAYSADLILSAEQLETGYSKEVDGQLTVISTREPGSQRGKSVGGRYHYKMNENNVQLSSYNSG